MSNFIDTYKTKEHLTDVRHEMKYLEKRTVKLQHATVTLLAFKQLERIFVTIKDIDLRLQELERAANV